MNLYKSQLLYMTCGDKIATEIGLINSDNLQGKKQLLFINHPPGTRAFASKEECLHS